MTAGDNPDPIDRIAGFLSLVNRATTALGSIIQNRASQVIALERMAVQRAAKVFALAFAAAVFAVAAAGFAAIAILAAVGEAHRVMGAACIAAGFALLAALAAFLARGRN